MTEISAATGYRCLPFNEMADDTCSLRAVQPKDIEAIRQWRNAQMDVLRQAEPISVEAQRAYFARAVWPAMEEAEPANLLLAFSEGEQLIGYGGLVHVSWPHRRAEVSFLLRPDLAANEGSYCSLFGAYLGLIKRLAFEGLGMNRLWTETYAFRDAHIATLEAAGFRPEGRMREHVVIDGRSTDSLIHGCLKDD